MPDALFLHAPRDARIGPLALPEGKPGETLLTVAAVGICGSDLHYYKAGSTGGSLVIAEPFVPGHEFGGWLEEDIPELGLARGTLVAVDPNHACGHCPWCRQGHRNLCPQVRYIGAPPINGAMTKQIWVPRSQIVKLPDSFGPLEAALLEPLGVALHAVDLARPRLGERVILLGCGSIGLLILQLLKLAGASEVMAIDPQPHRREMAASLGARSTGAAAAEAAGWTGGEGAALVIEATNSPLAFGEAVQAARIGGRLVLVGIPDGDLYTLPGAPARRRGLTVRFVRRMGDRFARAIALVAEGRVDVASLVSGSFALADGPGVFRRHAENAPGMIKSLILPQK
jgi:L-iditol 2-dehydrogenase